MECPIGFQKANDDARGCDCACNRILETYIVNCNYTRETITKRGTTAWIAHLTIKNTSGYLIYPQCPLDYCHLPDFTIEIFQMELMLSVLTIAPGYSVELAALD